LLTITLCSCASYVQVGAARAAEGTARRQAGNAATSSHPGRRTIRIAIIEIDLLPL
jgi:hypothetical protein